MPSTSMNYMHEGNPGFDCESTIDHDRTPLDMFFDLRQCSVAA